MKTILLCGGQGTRIRDVSIEMPKPLVPIGPEPILYHVMNYYALWGHTDFVLCLGYKSAEIKNFFFNHQLYSSDVTLTFGRDKGIEYHAAPLMEGWHVTMAETGLTSLTGTRVNRIRKYLGDDEDFMLTYADGLSDVDMDKLVAFHKSHGKLMTVTGVVAPGRFGEMLFDQSGKVQQFNEKPQCSAGRISGGYFVCRREIFDYLPSDGNYMLEQEPMQRLAEDGEMMVYTHDGFWHPMDTPRDYNYLNKLYENGEAPWTAKP